MTAGPDTFDPTAGPTSTDASPKGGRILVIGTPIGNLGDLSPRARDALARCDLLACEDTRRTGRLLQLSGINAPRLLRLDAHTEHSVAPRLIDRASRESAVVGVVSDAGMPGLSDPGSIVVSLAIEAGIPVEVIPGPFAGAVALVASGLMGDDGRFVFEGFLPRKGRERQTRLSELSSESRSIVIYESPHRVQATIQDLIEVLGPDRRASTSRELTKLHEETLSGSLSDLAVKLEESKPKGEFVLVVEGAPPPAAPSDEQLRQAYEKLRNEGAGTREAMAEVAQEFGVGLNVVKRLAFAANT